MWMDDYGDRKESFILKGGSEVASLPTHTGNNLGYGSCALVVETADCYFLTEDDQWTLLGGE